jgi:NlpC/P60 family putative phage cell wall peptidase
MSGAGNRVVRAARDWIGTPYVHQMATKGAGCDCLGLLRGVWREIVGGEPIRIAPYSMDWSEPQGEERLWQAAIVHLVAKSITQEAAGDVMLFRMREGAVAKHLGILTEAGDAARFIHSFSGHGVTESPLSAPWRRRIVARFEFPTEAL